MKRFSILCLLTAMGYFAIAQITITRADFVEVEDEIPRIFYSFDQDTESIFVDSIINDSVVFDDLVFPNANIDTLRYFPPAETDPEGLYAGATCSYINRDNYVMHLGISNEAVKMVGIQGQLPMTGDPMNLIFTDTLVMGNYPLTFDTNHADMGSASEKQHISVFESIIPEDYYETVSNFYDTVMFIMDLDLKVNYDEFGEMKYIGDSNLNGIYPYLRENRKLITRTDVQMRSKLSGTYTPLADIPGIGDQLPMELPMLDTTLTYMYWTNDMKSPLAEIELNAAHDSVYSVTFRYAYLSNVNSYDFVKHSVYPNPTTDYLNIGIVEYNDCSLVIYSIEGKIVKEFELLSEETKLNVIDLQSGNYIYHIINSKNISIAGGKFIKH